MNNSKFKEFKALITQYYNEYYNQYNGVDIDISNNNIVLQNALEYMNDHIEHHNIVTGGAILNDFCDQYGDMQLKESNIKKLIEWLKDQDITYLFEHDFIINKGADYYMSKQAFTMYKQEESEEELNHWLKGEKLTERQKNIIESELSSYINKEQTYLYIHCISFEFILPKKAILSAYIEYKRGER